MIKLIATLITGTLLLTSCGAEPYRKVKENASHLEDGLNDIGAKISDAGVRFNEQRLNDLDVGKEYLANGADRFDAYIKIKKCNCYFLLGF